MMKTIIPSNALPEPAETLLVLVDALETKLVVDVDVVDEVRALWASFCANIW